MAIGSATGCSLTRSLSELSGGDDADSKELGSGDGSSSTDRPRSEADGGVDAEADAATDAAVDGSDASGPIDTCSYRDCVLADSPAAYWRLGEASPAGMAVDESGHGHGATYAGGIVYGVAGAIAGDSNTAVRFDGTKALDVGNVFLFDGVLPFSLEVWVKPSPSSGYAVLLARDTDPNGYALYLSSNRVSFERQMSGDVMIVGGTSISTAKFNHLVGTFDGSRLRIYVNGDEIASAPSLSYIPGAASNFYIGTDNPSSTNLYKGDMDEPAVYDHALTPERIRVHYQAGFGTNK